MISDCKSIPTESQTTTLPRPERHLRGRPIGYEAALAGARPVSPVLNRAGLVMAYVDLIEGLIWGDGERRRPQLFVTLTPKPLGYSKAPVFPARLVQGQGALWSSDPDSLHGWPIYVSQKIACKLRDRVIEEIRRIQGYSPDYISFHERQHNGNHHYHLAMSNVNLQKPAFTPVTIRRDKGAHLQLAFRGLEKIAWGIMGRAGFEFWGGLDSNLTASYYFTRDMFRWSKGGEVDVEVSPRWGKRRHKQPPFTFTDRSLDLGCSREPVETKQGLNPPTLISR